MKKVTQILTALLLAVFAVPAMAQTQTEDDIKANGLKPYEELDLTGYTSTEFATYQGLFGFGANNSHLMARSATQDVLGSNTYCGDVEVPNTITRLRKFDMSNAGAGTFQYSYVTSVKLPSTITTIDQATFADCPYLTDIIVDPANSTYFDDKGVLYKRNGDGTYTLVAVPGNRGHVTILEGTTAIADCAFDGCFRITEVTIPATVTNIGIYAFTGSGITTLTCLATTPPEVDGTEGNNHGFYDMLNEGSIQLYVPAGSGEAYNGHQDWDQFKPANELEAPSIGDNTFALDVTFVATKQDNKVTAIKEIHVKGANGETFKDIPTGWTLTYGETVYKAGDGVMSINWHENDKTTVCITFEDKDNDGVDEPGLDVGDGTYTLNIPAESLEDTNGKKCVERIAVWIIEKPEPVYKDALHSVVITIKDADDTYYWRYEDVNGNEIHASSDEHTVGDPFKQETETYTDNSNNTTITTHYYSSDLLQYSRVFKNTEWQPLFVPFAMDYSDWSDQFEIATIDGIIENGFDSAIEFYVIGKVLESGAKTEANTPYLIRAKSSNADIAKKLEIRKGKTLSNANADGIKRSIPSTKNAGYTYNFVGQYTAARGTTGTNPKIAYNPGENKDEYNFVMAGGVLKHPHDTNGAKLGAFRWYLSITKNDAKAKSATFSFGNFSNDGTTGIEEVTTENVTVKGIYDLSGRKLDAVTEPGVYIIDGKKVLVK